MAIGTMIPCLEKLILHSRKLTLPKPVIVKVVFVIKY